MGYPRFGFDFPFQVFCGCQVHFVLWSFFDILFVFGLHVLVRFDLSL